VPSNMNNLIPLPEPYKTFIKKSIYRSVEEKHVPNDTIAVYISGGIDSAILLHTLLRLTTNIITYTFSFKGCTDELEQAKQTAEHYNVEHHAVSVTPAEYLTRFKHILKHFKRPRWNLWPWWLANKARKDCETGWNAEGLDELFSGYILKPNLTLPETWADHFIYIIPTWIQVHEQLNMKLVAPFTSLDFLTMLHFWDIDREKTYLRRAFVDEIPTYILRRPKRSSAPPYHELWEHGLSKIFMLDREPETDDEIRYLLQVYATQEWLKTHDIPRNE